MNLKLTSIVFLLIFTVFSCKKESHFSDYKYTDKPVAFTCEGINSKLLNEALYSFEDDIANHYKGKGKNYRLDQAYSQIIRNSVFGTLKLEDIVSKHTVSVFEALKNESWLVNNEAAVGLARFEAEQFLPEMKILKNDSRTYVWQNAIWVINNLKSSK